MKRKYWLAALLVALLTMTCKLKEDEPEPSGPISFEASPVDIARINRATPLGNLNPPGHTFPTDHIYFYMNGTSLVTVRAIAPGTVSQLYFNSYFSDYRIEFTHTSTFSSYLDHVKNPPAAVVVGTEVATGDFLGYSDPTTTALDLGVIDMDVTRGFIVPARYIDRSLHGGDPYSYFIEPFRSQLLAKNPRTVEPRGGVFDYDIDGRLVGNWFLEGIPADNQAAGIDYSYGHLAFVYDMVTPSEIHISCGGTLALSPFNRKVLGNSPNPNSVSVSSGRIKYELVVSPPAVLMVEMLGNRSIRAEVFPNRTLGSALSFTAAARNYIR